MANYIKHLKKTTSISQLNKLSANFFGVCLLGSGYSHGHSIQIPITPEQSLIAIGMALDELGIN